MTTSLFSIRRVSLCLLPFLVLALWVLALSGLATAGGRATAERPGRISVSIPSSAKSANIVMLELGISVVRKPKSGQLGAVVRLGGSEVGRVSIAGGAQNYQFNVVHALGQVSGGSAMVEVELIDRGGGSAPSGAELSIGRAQIVTR
jgi:hypothetical protein